MTITFKSFFTNSFEVILGAFTLLVAFQWRDTLDAIIKQTFENSISSFFKSRPYVPRLMIACILTVILVLLGFWWND